MKKTILCLLMALCLCLCLVLVSCSPEGPADTTPVPGADGGEKKGEVTFSPDAGGSVDIDEPNQQVPGSTVLH